MTEVLASALCGDSFPLRSIQDPSDLKSALATAARFGLEPLIRTVLLQRGEWSEMPADLRAAFDAAAHREVAIEALRHRETKRVLAAVGAAGVQALLLKGAALAHTHYPSPYLRPRSDTDLLIRSEDRVAAVRVLERAGYSRRNSVSSDAISRQAVFERHEASFAHVIDLHWAISNRPLFADMLSFDELRSDAVPISALGPAALTPGPVHALLFACIHRVAHHEDSPNPLWLYDMKLLAEGFTERDWSRFWSLASEKRIVTVCSQGLRLTTRLVAGPAAIGAHTPDEGDRREQSAAYIGGTGTPWRSFCLNVRGTTGFGAKARLLAAYAFPDQTYMRTAYETKDAAALTAAYVRRAVTGVRRLVSGS
jgi:hypothetical protein